MLQIELPEAVTKLFNASKALKEHFALTGLTFTLDGKLVGDIGEAIAASAFRLKLCSSRTSGVDAHTGDHRSVQIKATGNAKRGPAFTPGKGTSDYLLFLYIAFDAGFAKIVYNGPEARIRDLLPANFSGTKTVSLKKVVDANESIEDSDRLQFYKDLPH